MDVDGESVGMAGWVGELEAGGWAGGPGGRGGMSQRVRWRPAGWWPWWVGESVAVVHGVAAAVVW